jgi:ankyrin repeat protein
LLPAGRQFWFAPLAPAFILAVFLGAGAWSHAGQAQEQSDDPFGSVDFTRGSIDANRDIQNAFRNAVIADKVGLAEAFFRHGYKLPPTDIKSGVGDILADAIYFTRDPKMVRMLLDHGCKPVGDVHDWRATVNRALKLGNKEIVDMVIAAGSACDPIRYDAALGQLDDLKKRDTQHPLDAKQTGDALDYAVSAGQVETFDWLWARAQNPDAAANAKKLTGFYNRAAQDGNMALLLHLEQMGVKPADGGTDALLSAIGQNHVAVAWHLFDKGVKLPNNPKDFRSPLGETAGAALRDDNRVEMAGLLLDHGADINARDGEGMTPLCWAAYCGKDAVCQLLVQRGADLTIADKYGRTAVWYAAGSSHCPGALELMLKKGVPINWTDSNGFDLLTYAMNFMPPQMGVQGFPGDILTPAEQRDYDAREERTIDLLISAGLDPSGKEGADTPLKVVLQADHYPAARALLRHHPDLSIKDAQGNPAITYLFEYCHSAFPLDVLETMLQQGANPNASYPEPGVTPPIQQTVFQTALGSFRDTGTSQLEDQRAAVRMLIGHGALFPGVKSNADQALLLAAAKGDQAAMKAALARGASPDASDSFGYSPMMVSMSLRYFDNAVWLLQQGADPKKNATKMGNQLLDAAVEANRLDMVNLLLSKGVDAHSGYSGLDTAVQNGNREMFDTLLKAGADPKQASIFTCIQFGRPEMARILLDRGVDPQPPAIMENRANVYWAVYYNQPEILKMLLDHGADPSMVSAYGETPLSEAQQWHKDMVPVIQDALNRRHENAVAGAVPPDMQNVAQMAADDFKQGRYDQAVAGYGQMTKAHPDSLYAWSNLGLVRFQQQRYTDARDAFEHAVQLKPDDPLATANLGMTYCRLDAYDKALPMLKTAIQLSPNDANAHYFLGLAYASLKQQKDADAEFQKAKDLQSKSALPAPH